MATVYELTEHGLEVLKKAALLPDDTYPVRYALRTIMTDLNGRYIEINDKNQLKVVLDGNVEENNSSKTPLGVDAVFTGTGFETLDYALFFVNVISDVASADNGLMIQVSSDNVTWYNGDSFTIPANTDKTFSFQTNRRYARIVYTNGSVAQTTFDLETIVKKTNSKPSSHPIKDSISQEDDATLTKAVLTAQKTDGTFVNINSTESNNLKVANVEDGLSIAKGDVTNTSFIHKFGNAPDFDTADATIDIWDGADDAHIDQMAYVYSTTAAIDTISSDSSSDTFDVEIQGLDSNYDLHVQTATLNGQNKVTLTTPLIRIFRMKNVNTSDNVGHIYCYEDTAITGGVPNDSTLTRAVMQPGINQTLMAIYTIPAGKTGYMRDWYASTSGANKNSQYIIDLRARPFGQVFQLKHRTAISDAATSYLRHQYTEPEMFTEKTDIAMRATITDSNIVGASISAGFDVVLVDN